LALIFLSSGVSEAILRFNCSLVMPHFSLHQCFTRSISIPVVARIFGLSVPNLLKPSRSNGVKSVFVFHSLYLAV
ncbi:hypothetical protein, partial [Aliivibrio logei]|uniref:hypothetical protein n=1 Tax=Aliivibrio logei TaxID=688 RepID=UPI001C2F5941